MDAVFSCSPTLRKTVSRRGSELHNATAMTHCMAGKALSKKCRGTDQVIRLFRARNIALDLAVSWLSFGVGKNVLAPPWSAEFFKCSP